MSNDPLAGFSTITTPQNQQVPGRTEQVKNNAGGYVFKIDPLAQLRRFLTMGTTGGTYYVGAKELTAENGSMILELTKSSETHRLMVEEIVAISVAGRAPKPNPALFALAIACSHGDTESKQYARKQIVKVARTATHLFQFIVYWRQFGKSTMGMRKALANWYVGKSVDDLALQLIKYRQRMGWTHRDVLRVAHPKIEGPAKRAAVNWTINGDAGDEGSLPDFIKFFEMAQTPDANIPALLKDTYLPWEAIPDSAMNDVKVWDQMLENGMPINALVRQLPRLTSLEMLPNIGGRTSDVVTMLTNEEAIRKSRIHPFQVLTALMTYRQGHGDKGKLSWSPSGKIIDALDEMFYLSFPNVEPTGKRTMNALDVSGSMTSPAMGLPMSCREVTAALAMVTVRTEPEHVTVGFTGGGHGYGGYSYHHGGRTFQADPSGLDVLDITKKQRLDDVVAKISNLPFGRTDCALPMVVAKQRKWPIDTFVIYTDNETWVGSVHPFQALQDYRNAMGIDAKLVVVSITPTKFSIADPRDPGMLDVSGFDSAVPTLISDFSAGRV